MAEYIVRFAHHCGVGLDPYINANNRKDRKRQHRYLKGDYWHGGPNTATRFKTVADAESRIDKHGHRKAYGCEWLGHCDPCEVVTIDQAVQDDLSA